MVSELSDEDLRILSLLRDGKELSLLKWPLYSDSMSFWDWLKYVAAIDRLLKHDLIEPNSDDAFWIRISDAGREALDAAR